MASKVLRNKKMISTKSILPLVLSSLLAGCGDDSVNLVQDSYTYLNETLTIGQALNNRSICQKVDWSNFEDDKGRTIVEYKCYLNGAAEYFNTLKAGQISRAESSYTNRIEYAKETYERALQSITYNLKELKKLQEERKGYAAKLAEAQANYGSDGDSESHRQITIYEKKVGWVDEDISRIQYNILDEVDVEDTYNQALDSALQNKSDMLQKAENKYNLSDAYEVFQWSFNKNNEPVPIYTGMVILKDDGEKLSQSLDEQRAFSDAYKNKINRITQHAPIKVYLSFGLGLIG